MLLKILIFILIPLNLLALPPSRWTVLARQLVAENEIQKNSAILELKKLDGLDQVIKESLEHHNHIPEALQVVETLKMKQAFPNILKLAQKKPAPELVNALMSLRDSESEKELVLYIKTLVNEKWSELDTVMKLMALETASTLRINLPAKKLKDNLTHQSDQIRITSTRLAGQIFQSTDDESYAEILKEALSSKPYQLRLEALYAILEMSQSDKKKFKKELVACKQDSIPNIQKICSSILSSEK